MAAHQQRGAEIVQEQQAYASKHGAANIFETLQLAIIYGKPADPLEFIVAELSKIAADRQYEPKMPGRDQDTEEALTQYLESQRIQDVLEELFTTLLFHQPEDPLGFLAVECRKMQKQKAEGKATTVFDDTDLRGMHSLYDPSSKGHISRAQVAAAFKNLGLQGAPQLEGEGPFNADTFVAVARAALDKEKVL